MKIENHNQAVEAADEVMQLKNWTGMTLEELAIASRVTIHSDLRGWVRCWYAENDMVFGGFMAERVIDIVKEKVARL